MNPTQCAVNGRVIQGGQMKRIAMLLVTLAVGSLAISVPALSEPAPKAKTTTATPATPAALPANQYSSEADAKAKCGTEMVAWVNLSTKVFHYAGYKDYGKTKRGAYMCKAEAEKGGFRAAKTEKPKA